MAGWAANGAGWRVLAGIVLGTILAAGCGGKSPAPDPDHQAKEPPVSQVPPSPQVASSAKTFPTAALDPALNQPFAEATLADPPEGQELPDQTITGKSVGKLYTKVTALWDAIKFTTPGGKSLVYRAILETDQGSIEIVLRADIAPNHVRNFVALARAGYYDGLVFERTVHEVSDAGDGQAITFIEGGCPLGTGEPSYGSIGYWLQPELSDKVQHEPGTVGAWHVEEADTAACKFYISLTKAPLMDGNWTIFGKVVKGLDVARAISEKPVRPDEFRDRPEKPVMIRKVTILTQEEAN